MNITYNNEFVSICGFHNIHSCLVHHPTKILEIYLNNNRNDIRYQKIISLIDMHNIKYQEVSLEEIDKIIYRSNNYNKYNNNKYNNIGTNNDKSKKHQSNINHQGFLAIIRSSLIDFNDLLVEISQLDRDSQHNAQQKKLQIVIIDSVTDPQNLGAILRTCECFGVYAVIIPKDNSANPYNLASIKTSSGAVHFLRISIVNNITNAINKLKNHGFWVAGSALSDKSINLYEFKATDRMVWVVGNEQNGIRNLVLDNCDYIVQIPTFGLTESLNVGVATGIILSTFNR